MRRPLLAVLVAVFPFVAANAQQPGHAHQAGHELVGSVKLPTSCGPAAQPLIDRATAMLHSFWFEEARKTFAAAAAADPKCVMPHWGIAMTYWGNPFVRQPIPAELQKLGLAAATRAKELANDQAGLSHRERMYLDAALALWEGADTLDHLKRLARHEQAMEALAKAHPEDPEAKAFYARAVIANAPPTDLEFKRQLHAAQVLEPLFASAPQHPGLAHYIIHTFDTPALAKHGLAAARRYASIAPAAPHALHMPSHIFTRLGHWDESIETNRRSANAEPDSNAAVHPNDYMVYAYLQLGQDAQAQQVVARTRQMSDRYYGAILGYNAVALQARTSLERGQWAEAAKLAVPAGAAPYVTAVARFTRAIGSARAGDAAQAKEETAALATLRDSLKARNDAYWTTIVEAQRLAASAWAAQALGRQDEALRLAREGADLEETVEKHPVTPGPLLPARELLADLLLAQGRAADAQRAYETTLVREPRRARALAGAARAAKLAGDAASAQKHAAALADLMRKADAGAVALR